MEFSQRELVLLIRELDASLCKISSLILDSETDSFDNAFLCIAKCQTELSLFQLYNMYDEVCRVGTELIKQELGRKVAIETNRRRLEKVFAL